MERRRIGWWILFSMSSLANLYTHYLADLVLLNQGVSVLSLGIPAIGLSAEEFDTKLNRRKLAAFCLSALLVSTLFLP